MIENYDNINKFMFMEPTESAKSVDQRKIEIAHSESILSFKNQEQLSNTESASSSYVTPSKIKPKIGSCDKTPKKPVLKKSQFTRTSINQKKPVPKSLSLNDLSATSKLVPTMHAFQKSQSPVKAPSAKLPSPYVQRILEEAKQKRKKSQAEIPIPIVNLKFL